MVRSGVCICVLFMNKIYDIVVLMLIVWMCKLKGAPLIRIIIVLNMFRPSI